MVPNEYNLLAFDGGVTRGWFWAGVDYRAFSRPEHKLLRWLTFWDCGEFTGTEAEVMRASVRLMDRALERASYLSVDVISEDFDLVQLAGDKYNLLSPVRQNAITEWECGKRGIHHELQARQLRIKVTRERLKAWGFEGRFRRNEFAATQHGIVWLRRLKQRSISRPWKLSDSVRLNSHWDCSCSEGGNSHDLVHPS